MLHYYFYNSNFDNVQELKDEIINMLNNIFNLHIIYDFGNGIICIYILID
jgi:DNA-directed RNA polymerase alpha subunit